MHHQPGLSLLSEFEHLDVDVQEAFNAYLAERGVDESLCESLIKLLSLSVLADTSFFHPPIQRVQGAEGLRHLAQRGQGFR